MLHRRWHFVQLGQSQRWNIPTTVKSCPSMFSPLSCPSWTKCHDGENILSPTISEKQKTFYTMYYYLNLSSFISNEMLMENITMLSRYICYMIPPFYMLVLTMKILMTHILWKCLYHVFTIVTNVFTVGCFHRHGTLSSLTMSTSRSTPQDRTPATQNQPSCTNNTWKIIWKKLF